MFPIAVLSMECFKEQFIEDMITVCAPLDIVSLLTEILYYIMILYILLT